MFFSRRFLLITSFAVSAFAGSFCWGQAIQVAPADIPKLIDAARAAGVEINYDSSTETARGDGPSAKAIGDKAAQTIDGSAPASHLSGPNGAGATGGDTHAQQSAEVSGTVWFRVLLAVSGLGCLAGAGWKLYQVPPNLKVGSGLAAGGAVLLVCALWPALLWLLLVAAVLIAVPHFMPDKTKSALDAMVDGLAAAGPHPVVAAAIKAQATPADLAHIQQTAATNGNPINLG